MVGADPLFLSAGFIIEEGTPIDDIRKIVKSMKDTADEAGFLVVTGDTKVVERGQTDGVFINTSGIGRLMVKKPISGSMAKAGDKIIVSGPIGSHGMSIITSRTDYGFKNEIVSDVAPLNKLVRSALEVGENIHALRDATRGGVATVLNEIASHSDVGIILEEAAIPINDDVRGACELLGFDPLYVANEGVCVAAVDPGQADEVLQAMKKHVLGEKSAIIGEIVNEPSGVVVLKTTIGSHRIVDMLSGEQLPRIC
jgi:hydrogenase expression/formation protein HypE